MSPSWLLTLPIAVPLAGASLCLILPPGRLAAVGRGISGLAFLAALPPLTWAIREGALRQSMGGWAAPLGIELYLDGLSSLLVLFTAFTALCISWYAASYVRPSKAGIFWPLWFLTWGGLQAMFLSADLFNVYVTLELIGIASVGLVALGATRNAVTAAFRYQLLALLGALSYLLGIGFFYNVTGTLDMAQVAGQLPDVPLLWIGVVFMIGGLAIKTALFPLHFWLPRAHANAPAPVSAALSGLVITAGYILFLRLWYSGIGDMAPRAFHNCLASLGGMAVVYGGLQALVQNRLKLILAYSTVSQVGYLFLVFGLSGVTASVEGLVWSGAVYMALSHGLAKAGAFLAAGGLMQATGGDDLKRLQGAAVHHPLMVIALALAAINLMGLPPSAGFLAKWMLLKAALELGAWPIAGVIVIGGLLAAAYLFRVLAVCMRSPEKEPERKVPLQQSLPALMLALATIALALMISNPQALLSVSPPVDLSNYLPPGVSP